MDWCRKIVIINLVAHVVRVITRSRPKVCKFKRIPHGLGHVDLESAVPVMSSQSGIKTGSIQINIAWSNCINHLLILITDVKATTTVVAVPSRVVSAMVCAAALC